MMMSVTLCQVHRGPTDTTAYRQPNMFIRKESVSHKRLDGASGKVKHAVREQSKAECPHCRDHQNDHHSGSQRRRDETSLDLVEIADLDDSQVIVYRNKRIHYADDRQPDESPAHRCRKQVKFTEESDCRR